MYEQVSHSLLNEILDELKPEIRRQDLRHFYTRLGANFYAIHSLFSQLYGQREGFRDSLLALIERLASAYIDRPVDLERIDVAREEDHEWFLSQQWVGMALYCDAFAGSVKGLEGRIGYLQELGVNLVHVMPILRCPPGASDGGYAVSDFRAVDPRVGELEDVRRLASALRERDMLLTLDVVLNHTSDQHEWAQRARAGEQDFQDFYHVFPDRELPDAYETTMPEVFPETAPGSFTWDEQMQQWVMTVFNHYQWDLNYANPAVFIEVMDVILFWANQGADVLRLDAVAFLWKKLGTTCQNQREAHLILQLLKDCCQVVAPGVLFIAEAIVAPDEIIRYFGEDAVIAKECEIAYNATLMALLWDGVATSNARLLNQGLRSLPDKLDRATWLNYVRCHDDIGFGFDDEDIRASGYEPADHRRFLVAWFTGRFEGSPSRGLLFGENPRTGDARISGALASLAGLEAALAADDARAVDDAIRLILMLHGIVMSFGGIPLLYAGDELGTLNDASFRADTSKAGDSRWAHRPRMDWERAERRREHGTVEQRLWDGLRHMIETRKSLPALGDFNNREILDVGEEHLLAYLRTNPARSSEVVLVVANFDTAPRQLDLRALGNRGTFAYGQPRDLLTNAAPDHEGESIVIHPHHILWLAER